MDKKTLDVLSGAKDRIKEVVNLMENIELIRKGVDDSGATHYTSYGAPQLDIDRCNIALKGVIETLADAIEEQKAVPEKSYKERVFDLISSQPIPGVESIEVNESQRKFVVKYKYDEPPEAKALDLTEEHAEKWYTFDDIKEVWYKFKEHEEGPWEGDFLVFLYGYDFPKHKTIKEVKPVFHDRLMAEPKLTKE